MMYVFLILGFLLLIKGADYFVEACSSVARALRIPSIWNQRAGIIGQHIRFHRRK